MCVYYIQPGHLSNVAMEKYHVVVCKKSARAAAPLHRQLYCDRMLHPEETTNLADFKLPNPDTRLVVFGDAVFKLKYKLR